MVNDSLFNIKRFKKTSSGRARCKISHGTRSRGKSKRCRTYLASSGNTRLGDLPATTKWKHKELTNLYEAAELKELSSLGVAPNCPDKYIDRIKMSDMLELVLHCYRQIQLGNSLAEPVLKNGVNYLNDKFKDHSDFGPVASILKELEK